MPAALSSSAQCVGLAGELGRLHLRLLRGRRRAGEALPAQLVHLAALLVGGDQQPDAAGGLRRHEPLEVRRRAGRPCRRRPSRRGR